jgi:uncharacterized small protein (DUF1192 family)
MTQLEIEAKILELLSVYGIASKVAILEKIAETLKEFQEKKYLHS